MIYNRFEKYGLKPFGAVPNELQMEQYRMQKKAFIHFGMNTFTDDEVGDGSAKAETFNPTDCDVRQWVRSLKAAGFPLIILTAKHDDGFCLWPSKYSDYTVANSLYQKDIVREFVDACHEYNVKVGIYLAFLDNYVNVWGTPANNDFYANQLTELMTQYGRIDEVWWDGAGAHTDNDWARWAEIVRKNQPHAAIFGAWGAAPYIDLRWVGNERGFAGEMHFATIDLEHIIVENTKYLNAGVAGASHYVPSETDVSVRPGWFYHKDQDNQVKSAARINRLWFESVGRNSTLNLNFPPDRRGRIHEIDLKNAMESHRCISEMLAINYATDALVSADSVLCEECAPEKAVLSDDTLFYAAATDRSSAQIDIVLPEARALNVLCLGEMVELGERITEFTVEDCSDGEAVEVFHGTSVGYYRLARLPEKEYRHLRVCIKSALASPILRTIGLHKFTDCPEPRPASFKDVNIAELSSAKTIYSQQNHEAEIIFGGIYPFDLVEFKVADAGECTLLCYDGSKYVPVQSVQPSKSGYVYFRFEHPQKGSFQIKIQSTAEIMSANGIRVLLQSDEKIDD